MRQTGVLNIVFVHRQTGAKVKVSLGLCILISLRRKAPWTPPPAWRRLEKWFWVDRNKASSSNGFSMAFFQDNWEGIKDDLERVFKDFCERGILDSTLNGTYVCPIPKKERANKVKRLHAHYSHYECVQSISKVLSNRLKSVCSSTYECVQSIFKVFK